MHKNFGIRSHTKIVVRTWVWARPVTREGLRGRSPPRKIFAPPGKMCWTSFKTIGHSSKTLGPSQKTLRPSWCHKLVTGLVWALMNRKLCLCWEDIIYLLPATQSFTFLLDNYLALTSANLCIPASCKVTEKKFSCDLYVIVPQTMKRLPCWNYTCVLGITVCLKSRAPKRSWCILNIKYRFSFFGNWSGRN